MDFPVALHVLYLEQFGRNQTNIFLCCNFNPRVGTRCFCCDCLRVSVTRCISAAEAKPPFKPGIGTTRLVRPLPPSSCTNSCTHFEIPAISFADVKQQQPALQNYGRNCGETNLNRTKTLGLLIEAHCSLIRKFGTKTDLHEFLHQKCFLADAQGRDLFFGERQESAGRGRYGGSD
jgi:hypothetical protein